MLRGWDFGPPQVHEHLRQSMNLGLSKLKSSERRFFALAYQRARVGSARTEVGHGSMQGTDPERQPVRPAGEATFWEPLRGAPEIGR